MRLKSIEAWSQTALLHSAGCTNETSAKSSLIIPFFNHLGYDPSDPRAFAQEHRVELGKKYPDRSDIVLSANGNPAIVVECKAPGKSLPRYFEQLSRYFNEYGDAAIGVLTDGLHFQFFTDADKDGALDNEPFLTLSLKKLATRGLTATEEDFLARIQRDSFDEPWITRFAEAELLRKRLTRWLMDQLKSPSPQFCRYVLAQLDIKHVRGNRLEICVGLLQDAFAHGLANEIYEKIRRGRSSQAKNIQTKQAVSKDTSKIVTTERELQIFELCKHRLAHLTRTKSELNEINNIHYRDFIRKFSVFYMKPKKGKLFDYVDEGDRDKFVFYINDDQEIIYNVASIDKPLLASFRQRLEAAQTW